MAPTLNQFRYFCELASVGHFGSAADRLNMSQPPLSRQIAALEAELGTVLFERTYKGVSLTAAGRPFREDASEVLRLAAQAECNAVAAGRGKAGQLTIGFTMCAAYSVVPALAQLYMKSYSGVDIRVREQLPDVLEHTPLAGLFLATSHRGNKSSSLTAIFLSVLKLIGQPAVTALCAYGLFRSAAVPAEVAVLLSALPTGTGPYMIAEFYRREAVVTAGTILFTTLASVFTLAACLSLVRHT